VLLLKALCDLRLDHDDLRATLEEAVGAGKAKKAAPPQQQTAQGTRRGAAMGLPPPDPADARGWAPLGADSRGCRWYFLDAPPAVGVHEEAAGLIAERLYRRAGGQGRGAA
jgi:hypothetical protein